MKLNERINVLIQSTALSQKSGNLTLDEAVRAKTAIDIISFGELNQNFAEAINVLIELAVLSQKKGVFSLKDAYMIYLAIEGIENEFRYEVSKLSSVTQTPSGVVRKEVDELTEKEVQNKPVLNHENNVVEQQTQKTHETRTSGENIITVPPVTLKID